MAMQHLTTACEHSRKMAKFLFMSGGKLRVIHDEGFFLRIPSVVNWGCKLWYLDTRAKRAFRTLEGRYTMNMQQGFVAPFDCTTARLPSFGCWLRVL